jgi:PST family polysaccharide transporter
MTFLSTPLIVLAFGKHYAPAGLVLSVHIWSSMFSCFGVIKDTWIAVEGLTSYALSISILGALMNILLNFWLIPIYGAMGAAVATVVSYGFTDYITCFLYPPARPMGWVMTKALSLSNLSNLIRR